VSDAQWLSLLENARFFFVVVTIVGAIGTLAAEWAARKPAQRIENARQAEVARLAKQSEDDRKARERIERKLAPRSLNPEQQNALSEKLRLRSGQPADLHPYANDSEVMALANQLVTALRSAGWNVTVFGGIVEELRSVAGILVETTETATPRDAEAASLLVKTLSESGLFAVGPMKFDPKYDTAIIDLTAKTQRKPAPIRITVGRKR
jgi:hypothetical protein